MNKPTEKPVAYCATCPNPARPYRGTDPYRICHSCAAKLSRENERDQRIRARVEKYRNAPTADMFA